jgi:hypothetical protein
MEIKQLTIGITLDQEDRNRAIEINEMLRNILSHSTEDSVLSISGNRWSMDDIRYLQLQLSVIATTTEMTLENPDLSMYEDTEPDVEYSVEGE